MLGYRARAPTRHMNLDRDLLDLAGVGVYSIGGVVAAEGFAEGGEASAASRPTVIKAARRDRVVGCDQRARRTVD